MLKSSKLHKQSHKRSNFADFLQSLNQKTPLVFTVIYFSNEWIFDIVHILKVASHSH